ncbi:hypothetical protein EUGRSUZ_L02347 [Eucalyptus grandis]|uniref:Uncharacterized protein n=1 Tax=Eucalyptus grandis TaxID=71139 RepID=A0A058ZR03_EUCGR|nr:hypothetical protein EUGRSUZ_L02347 [Eucalyptus grandis]
MEMLVEVTSREAVKPSSPAPHHLKTFNLCLLDQMTLAYYTPMVFFYPVHKPRGLSLTALARFYPLAGRLDKNNLHIDCNDTGILYVEAQVCGSLSEFLKKPKIVLLDEFLPLHGLSTVSQEEAVLLGIQVNVFSCGGIVIGTSSSHKIMDRTTISVFLRTWAAIAAGSLDQAMRAECMAASTIFPRSKVMPPNARV